MKPANRHYRGNFERISLDYKYSKFVCKVRKNARKSRGKKEYTKKLMR